MPGRYAINIGRLFGIQVALDMTWFMILVVMVLLIRGPIGADFEMTQGPASVLSAALVLLLFASVLAHEFGHALTARAFGIRTPKIVLHMFGGVAYLESEPRKPSHEFWITAAGPAVSFLLGVVFVLLMLALNPFGQDALSIIAKMCLYLGFWNLFLAIFNCLPGFPMDGGRIVRATIWGLTGNFVLATRLAAAGGMVVGALIVIWGVSGIVAAIANIDSTVLAVGGPMRILLGCFLIYLAWQSARQAVITSRLRDIRVTDFVRPVRVVVPSDTLISDVIERYMQPFGMDELPVVEGSRLIGSISYDDIVQVPHRQWDWVRASELVRAYSLEQAIDPSLGAMAALQRLARMDRAFLPVFHGRRLMGHVFRNDLIMALGMGQR